MTKLLDADWLRSVQLFHYLYSTTINDFGAGSSYASTALLDRIFPSGISENLRKIYMMLGVKTREVELVTVEIK